MVKKEPKIIAKESRIAKTFKFSERKVRTYFKEARVEPAKYNLMECIEIYVNKTSSSDEKEEYTKAQKELVQMKNKILKDEYVLKTEVNEMVSEMLAAFKNKLQSLNKKIRVALHGADEIKHDEIIKKQLLDAMQELKEYGELLEDDRSAKTNRLDS